MKLAGCAAAVAACTLALPLAAHAHPRLVGSTPRAGAVLSSAPVRVVLRFDERVDPVGAGVSVADPRGRDAGAGPVRHTGGTLVRRVRAAGRGTYVVEWLVVGADTHPARGALVYSVGAASGGAPPGSTATGVALQATGRWVSLAGFALGFGVPFAAAVALGGVMTRRAWHLVAAGVVLMVVAEPLSLLGQTVTLQPSQPLRPRLVEDVLLTSYGHAAGLRLGAALALWALAGAVRQAVSPRALWAIPALGAALAVAHADAAHRIPGVPTVVSLLVVAVHVAAFGAWLGLVVAALATGTLSRRLVAWAVGTTLVLAVSGAGLAVGQLDAVRSLVETAYGEALLVKLGLAGAALALGALGRRRAELAAAATVLAAAAVLVTLLPPA